VGLSIRLQKQKHACEVMVVIIKYLRSKTMKALHVSGRCQGFTLLELLSVVAVMAVLTGLSVPAFRALQASGGVGKAAVDLAKTLELARVHAMANGTYVRVVFSEIPESMERSQPATVALVLVSANGSDAGDMADVSEWRTLSSPLVLDNLKIFDSLDARQPDTGADVTPAGRNDTGTRLGEFSRQVSGWGGLLRFNAFVQFSPSGEAGVSADQPARYIKIALDRPKPGVNDQALARNPFILRLSGTNGSINVLRAEAMNL
jgi:prepilin-type N-terminal cleavage/methylation domain-containing protein